MSSLSTLPKGDSAWLLRKSIQRVMQQVSVLETNIGSSTTGNSANTQIIFNDAGTLRGDAQFTWNKTLNRLTVDGDETITGDLTINNDATITGDLTVDTSTLKVDSTNDRVGIGTTSPAVRLNVADADNAANGTIRLGVGAIYSQIKMSASSTGRTDFTNVGNGANGAYNFSIEGQDQYRISSSGVFTWYDGAGGTRMTLNSTGLGVGVASPSFNIHARGTTDGRIQVEGASGYGMVFVQASSGNTAQLQLNSNGGSGRRYVVASNTSGQFLIGDETAVQTRLLIDSSGNVGIGVTPSAGKGCLQLSSGINFPATQVASSDANTLDDYEEGTFAPTIIGTTTAGTGTYILNQGRYTKIGNRVFCDVYISWSAHTGTGNISLEGLPFTSNASISAISIGLCSNIALTAGNILTGCTSSSSTQIAFQQYPSGGGARSAVPIDTAAEIQFSVCYFV